uniref:Uncharacterized protein n=1 Tax=Mucochytrium quahogii TaxID=96639 RepID=A0A7S2S832_9STRA
MHRFSQDMGFHNEVVGHEHAALAESLPLPRSLVSAPCCAQLSAVSSRKWAAEGPIVPIGPQKTTATLLISTTNNNSFDLLFILQISCQNNAWVCPQHLWKPLAQTNSSTC